MDASNSPSSRRGRHAALWTIFLAALLAVPLGCGGVEKLGTVHTAKTVSYVPGIPNFDLEAIGERGEDDSRVRLHLGIPPASLVFLRDSTRFRATYELSAALYEPDSKQLVTDEEWQDTVWSARDMGTVYEPLTRTRTLAAPPGEYLLRVVLRDGERDKPAERIQRVTIPAVQSEETYVSGLRLEHADESGSFRTLARLHLPSGLDSLRAIATIQPSDPESRLEVEWSVVRYESDHTVANPPHWLTPPPGSLEYLGIDYGSTDTIATSRAVLENLGARDSLTYLLPEMREGMYRVVLRAAVLSGGSVTERIEQYRDVSVKNPHFPEVASQEELIDALTYIARDKEMERIRAPEAAPKRKTRFDSFWGEIARNEAHASRLLETYYERVQEANLYFTTHKSGWKTDRGMVYVVMGPPVEIEHYVDREIWYYGYPTNDPRRVYVFERGATYDNRGLTFENFVLQRQPYYQDYWQRHVYDWRRGRVL